MKKRIYCKRVRIAAKKWLDTLGTRRKGIDSEDFGCCEIVTKKSASWRGAYEFYKGTRWEPRSLAPHRVAFLCAKGY